MTNLELTRKVAELLGWTDVDKYPPLLGRTPEDRNVWAQIPCFTTNLNACIDGICKDERVTAIAISFTRQDVWLWCHDKHGNVLGNTYKRHDNTHEDIARAICEAFIRLCKEGKAKKE